MNFETIKAKCLTYIKQYPELKLYTSLETVKNKFKKYGVRFCYYNSDESIYIYKERTGFIELEQNCYNKCAYGSLKIMTPSSFHNANNFSTCDIKDMFSNIMTLIDKLNNMKPITEAKLAYAAKLREKREAEKWVTASYLEDQVIIPNFIIKYDAELEKQGVNASLQNPNTDIRIKMKIWITSKEAYNDNGIKYVPSIVLDCKKKILLKEGKPFNASNSKNVIENVLLNLKNGKFKEQHTN